MPTCINFKTDPNLLTHVQCHTNKDTAQIIAAQIGRVLTHLVLAVLHVCACSRSAASRQPSHPSPRHAQSLCRLLWNAGHTQDTNKTHMPCQFRFKLTWRVITAIKAMGGGHGKTNLSLSVVSCGTLLGFCTLLDTHSTHTNTHTAHTHTHTEDTHKTHHQFRFKY